MAFQKYSIKTAIPLNKRSRQKLQNYVCGHSNSSNMLTRHERLKIESRMPLHYRKVPNVRL